MSEVVPINLAAEDALSEAVLLKLLRSSGREFAVGTCYSQGGFGYLRRTIRGFNSAGRGTPFLVLADLDRADCPPVLLREWLPTPKHPNLVFRIAVREVEAWLLADAPALSRFLGVDLHLLPRDPESLADPKQVLIRLAARSRSRPVREDLVPPPGSKREQGPNYNGRLARFVEKHWNPMDAAAVSTSLRRALAALNRFVPTWARPS